MQQIQELAQRIGQEFCPDRVLLFGSHAYGEPGADSDVDMLVIMRHEGKNWRMATEIRGRVRPRFPLDLIVRTPDQIRERLELGDCFVKEITEKGKALYESPDR